jgi:hypothetical protein
MTQSVSWHNEYCNWVSGLKLGFLCALGQYKESHGVSYYLYPEPWPANVQSVAVMKGVSLGKYLQCQQALKR